MNQSEFEKALRARLSGLPKEELDERLAFYMEMIDDRIEDGRSEEEAVAEIGPVEEIAEQIVSEVPLTRLARERIRPKRRLRAWEIVLIAVGSPIWFSLLVAAFAVILSLYAVIWSLAVALWAVFGALGGCGVGVAAMGGILLATGNAPVGIAALGAGLVCSGLAILLFFGCVSGTRGILWLTRRLALGVKNCVVGKGEI